MTLLLNASAAWMWRWLLLLLPIYGYEADGLSSVSSSASPPPPPPYQKRRTAVVVGGGPAGLAAATVLSKCHDDYGFDQITILELDSKASYDPSRAYFYNINKRGQRFTDAFHIDLSERGVGVTEFARHTVPADPDEIFDGKTPFSRDMNPEERRQMGTMYWIPRHELVQLLMDSTTTTTTAAATDDNNNIQLRLGVRCKYVEPTKDGRVKVVGVFQNGTETNFITDLCVGADGMSSTVRQSLADGRFEGWTNARPARFFRPRQYTSPSTGLRIKGLRLQMNFSIPVGGAGNTNSSSPQGGEQLPLEQKYNYALMSATTGPKDSLTLTLLPQKQTMDARPINICTMPNHDIWNMKDGPSVKEYFTKAFPRFDWNSVVAPEEWDAFAGTQGSSFPKCQYTPRLYVSSQSTGSGVVLIGDALHAFPPDLGQGVNSAFCDVMTLGDCLEEASSGSGSSSGSDENGVGKDTAKMLTRALQNYQTRHGPETRALIQLARCGAPFQYNQPSRFMKFRKTLWTANIAMRLLLNKVTKGLSPKPAILLMMNSSMSFRQVMRRANTLTLVLWTFLVSALWKVIALRP